MDPAEQDDVLADVRGRQLTGGVGAREFSERADFHYSCRLVASARARQPRSPRETDSCSPVFRFFNVTSPRATFVRTRDGDERDAPRCGVFELLPELVGLGIHVDPDAGGAQLRREPQCVERLASQTACTITSAAAVCDVSREHVALRHHDEDPLEAEREAAGRNRARRRTSRSSRRNGRRRPGCRPDPARRPP